MSVRGSSWRSASAIGISLLLGGCSVSPDLIERVAAETEALHVVETSEGQSLAQMLTTLCTLALSRPAADACGRVAGQCLDAQSITYNGIGDVPCWLATVLACNDHGTEEDVRAFCSETFGGSR